MIHSQLASLWKEVLSIRCKAFFSFSLASPIHTHTRYHYQPLQHFTNDFKENIEKYLVFSDDTKLKGCIIFFFFFMIYLFIYSFSAVPGLDCCCPQACSCCRRVGAPLQGRGAGFSLWCLFCWGVQALGSQAHELRLDGSRAQAQQLWPTGLAAPHLGPSQTRDWTRGPCTSRQILHHGANQGSLGCVIFWWLSRG